MEGAAEMGVTRITKFNQQDLFGQMGAGVPAPVPVGDVVSLIRAKSLTPGAGAVPRIGVWESTPGRWVRQVKEAEFCVFLDGECSFEPDGGEAIEIGAGDVLYFPENSQGTWDIRATSRKIFLIFAEP
jgi:uncharacterized cupin superfamily protein